MKSEKNTTSNSTWYYLLVACITIIFCVTWPDIREGMSGAVHKWKESRERDKKIRVQIWKSMPKEWQSIYIAANSTAFSEKKGDIIIKMIDERENTNSLSKIEPIQFKMILDLIDEQYTRGKVAVKMAPYLNN